MKTTGFFKVHEFDIPFKRYGDTIKIVPFSDIHKYAPLHAEKVWYKFIDRYKNDKSAYFIGGGDYMDELSTSERHAFYAAHKHDSTEANLNEFYVGRAMKFAKEISFMKGRLIGLCEGNHYYQGMFSGMTTTQMMCQELETTYLGVKTFVILNFRYDKHHCHQLILCYHHGEGGGRRSSSSVGKLENMAHTTNADIILQGHDHRINHIQVTELGVTDSRKGHPTEVQRVKHCARTGGFLKGYVNEHRSYIADANLPPNALGNVEFHITPMKKTVMIEPEIGRKYNREEKRWLHIEFHACNYSEH